MSLAPRCVGLGGGVQLPQSKFEQSVGPSSRPTHALALEAATDRQVDMLFHSAGALKTNQLGLLRWAGTQRAGSIETSLVGLQIGEESSQALRITAAGGLSQADQSDEVLPVAGVEGRLEASSQLGMVREGPVKGAAQVPPIELVSGPPAVVPGQSLNPVGAVAHQEQMLRPAQAQAGLPGEEKPFAEVASALYPAIAHPLQQPVTAMFGRQAFQSFPAGEHPQAHFELGRLFPLSPQEGAIDFGEHDLPLAR